MSGALVKLSAALAAAAALAGSTVTLACVATDADGSADHHAYLDAGAAELAPSVSEALPVPSAAFGPILTR